MYLNADIHQIPHPKLILSLDHLPSARCCCCCWCFFLLHISVPFDIIVVDDDVVLFVSVDKIISIIRRQQEQQKKKQRSIRTLKHIPIIPSLSLDVFFVSNHFITLGYVCPPILFYSSIFVVISFFPLPFTWHLHLVS